MPRKRRLFDGAFKTKVALDAIRGLKTVSELAALHRVHPTQITLWKKQPLEGAATVFESGAVKKPATEKPSSAELYELLSCQRDDLFYPLFGWTRIGDKAPEYETKMTGFKLTVVGWLLLLAALVGVDWRPMPVTRWPSSTVLDLAFVDVQWRQVVTVFPVVEAGQFVAFEAALAVVGDA